MDCVLVSSRSFGSISEAGGKLLESAGFRVQSIAPQERPIAEEKMVKIITREKPTVVICGAEPITRSVMEACPSLFMVMKHGVGIDNIDLDAATDLKIAVASAPGTNTESVADLTIAMTLALVRGVFQSVSSTKAGRWDRYVGHDLGALTIGVVGTGRIGLTVIRRFQGFGSSVLAYDVVQNLDSAAQLNFRYVSLEHLLQHSDIVTLHAPLADSTRKMIGRRELERMKTTAYLLNLARGELCDEEALCEFLQQRRIAGAAVDVFSVEPPEKSPLLRLDNVLATPHIAAYTYESMERMDRVCAQTVIDASRGKVCSNILNPEVIGVGEKS
ncbi:MAG: phosphoglycerate dehydrogenase [Chloroflexi bacterium]|nr:phosphoglycerate dehydrogenase [Chloroflexota bacterium]